MYTVVVNDTYSYSFENKDSALRFLNLVQNICASADIHKSNVFSSADIHKSNVFSSCDEAMSTFSNDNPKRSYISEERHCSWDENNMGIAPCCEDFELSCESCLYFH